MRVKDPEPDQQARIESEPDVVETSTSDSPEALIEEARQHQRRRRLWFVVAVLAVALAVVAGLTFSGGSGGSKPRAVTYTKPRAKHAPTPIQKTKKNIPAASSNFCGSQPQMQFVNADDGWLYMGEGTILATTDQGQHWSTAYKGPDCVTSFDFVNPSDGWALTGVDSQERLLQSSTILHTENGGRTWVSQHGPRGVGFVSIEMDTPTTGWAVSTVGQLFHSLNAGDTWQRIPSPGPIQTLSAQSLTICSDSEGTWLALKDGNIVSSLPGTTTWTPSLLKSQVPSPYGTQDSWYQTADLGCFGQTVWAEYFFGCGAGTCWGQVERSLDGGAHWEALPNFGTDESLGGVTSPTNAWFLGYAFVSPPSVQATTDDGATFRNSLIYPQGGSQVEADVTTFVSTSQGWAVVSLFKNEGTSATSSPPELIGTDDGGTTWHVVSTIPGL